MVLALGPGYFGILVRWIDSCTLGRRHTKLQASKSRLAARYTIKIDLG